VGKVRRRVASIVFMIIFLDNLRVSIKEFCDYYNEVQASKYAAQNGQADS
jgi:hypothetical protein